MATEPALNDLLKANYEFHTETDRAEPAIACPPALVSRKGCATSKFCGSGSAPAKGFVKESVGIGAKASAASTGVEKVPTSPNDMIANKKGLEALLRTGNTMNLRTHLRGVRE
jgi:hypothetical protein